MYRRSLASLAIGLIGASLLDSACGLRIPGSSSNATESSNALTVWYFDKTSMETVIPLFEQSHPGVKVNFVEQPFGDMSKKYLAALAAGQGVPDVIGLDTSMVGQFLDAGEDLLAQPYAAGQFRDDFVEWKFDAAQTSSGQMTAIPWDVATGVMFYRPDIFQSAGLPTDPNQVASQLASWADFVSAGAAIKATGGGRGSIVGSEHDVFNAAYWQNGGNVVQNGQIVLVPEGLQPLRLAVQARQAGIGGDVPAWSDQWQPALQNGSIATVLAGGWMLGDLETLIDPNGAGNWRVAPAAGGPFSNGGTYIQIPRLAANKSLAWEFTRFLATDPGALTAVFQRTGIVPAYRPAWNSPVYDQPVPYLGGQPAFRLMLNLAQQVKPLTYSPVDALGTDLLNAQVDLALAGQVAPEEALQNAATQLQDRALRESNLQLDIASS
jgi:multiple sugar transport system substrate-binding protein